MKTLELDLALERGRNTADDMRQTVYTVRRDGSLWSTIALAATDEVIATHEYLAPPTKQD